MNGNSKYDREELSAEDIRQKRHREFVGGMWEQVGRLQLDYLISRGLKPEHRLLDVGCGSLRGGLHFIDYLATGNYYGIDVNPSLIKAAEVELTEAGLTAKAPKLIVNGEFAFDRLGDSFDMAVAVSVFTHLPRDQIVRCLKSAASVLGPNAAMYATYFEAPGDAWVDEILHQPGGIVTHHDMNPYHYSRKEVSRMAELGGLSASFDDTWRHPRAQQMAVFQR